MDRVEARRLPALELPAVERNALADGGWTDEWLNQHARYVVDRLRG